MQKQANIPSQKRRSGANMLGIALICAASFIGGWFVHNPLSAGVTPKPLRLGGYKFIGPLLTCNFGALKLVPESRTINQDVAAVIDAQKKAGVISKASIYFGDFVTNAWASVNGDEKYYPSSITKIPIMMAYYELAKSSSSILRQKIVYPAGSTDLNGSQEIRSEEPLVAGTAYTVQELIDRMIKYSDNNAAGLLYENIYETTLTDIYNDLQLPVNPNPTVANLDFMTPQRIGILFRILYNSTYLSHDDSERALELLSTTSFTEGLVAGVPNSTIVSHKFGIVGITANGIETERELHDCGIVYAPGHPYLLCAMTRGSAIDPESLTRMKNAIAQISSVVYADVENGKE
jgi:hypothetical protein